MMPIYVYQPSTDRQCAHCENGFEQLQKLDASALLACPECGAPIKRVLTAPNLAAPAPSLTADNIGKHGFTQYRKVEKGVYEKTVGQGPDLISDKK